MEINSIFPQLPPEDNQDNFTYDDYRKFDEYFTMNQPLSSTDIVNTPQEEERKDD